MNVIDLALKLISCPSVTPITAGAFDVLEDFLVPLGFTTHRVTFEDAQSEPVENIYLRYGTRGKNFCFGGHTDVVPPGNLAAWSVPPFAPVITDGVLYGRGAEDMKGAVAAFMIAARDFIATTDKKDFSISLLITQDEEGKAVNGIRKMLPWLAEKNEKIDACIVGEPTNVETLGDMVKIGRRGSIRFQLTVNGKQGHAAYPERADNPITRIVNMLHALKTTPLDAGYPSFPPSNLEITSVDVGNPTDNVIPASATARFNIRFNPTYTAASAEAWVRERCAGFGNFELVTHVTGEAFLTRDEHLIGVVTKAVEDVTGITPELSTVGGTSDARHIRTICPVIEFGTTGRTPHMVNECVEVKTLEGLAKVYQRVLEGYFA